ncbi:MAG: O-antigen ligase family protein [Bryobacterales bacterium]|nr:O-antigen ligase family protein [Bryobacterales bacterium]
MALHTDRSLYGNALLCSVIGAAITTLVSIRVFETLMALTLVLLLATRHRWRLPPVWLPLLLFVLGTLVSLVASGHIREGLPQVRKFYVYLMLFLVTSVLQSARQVRSIALGCVLAASISSVWALVQFAEKYRAAELAHQNFYTFYVDARITGFMGHWMTLSGELMMVLLLIGALGFFAKDRSWIAWLLAAALPIFAALVCTWTRSMWLGTLCGGIYLIWFWKKWALIAVPVLTGLLLIANPIDIRERAVSALFPHQGATDSNGHRAELRRIGWEMIKAHPWLGVGPEQVSRQYRLYIRPDMPRPQSSQYYGHLENDYVQYAAERGVPTLLALLWMIGWALFDFVRALRFLPHDAEERWVLHSAVAVIIGVLVSGFYSWNLNNSEILALFLAVIGCGYVAVWQASAQREHPFTPVLTSSQLH